MHLEKKYYLSIILQNMPVCHFLVVEELIVSNLGIDGVVAKDSKNLPFFTLSDACEKYLW